MLIGYTYSPRNPQELFNLRHAQARNVIERIFGVLKRRFRILLLGPEYQYSIQAQIPAALCAIHNFIRIHNPSEEDSAIGGAEEQYNQQADAGDDVMRGIEFQESADDTVVARRDRIATEMWTNYQEVLQSREESESEDDTEFDWDTEE
jgi:DDE superfamily endonuclease